MKKEKKKDAELQYVYGIRGIAAILVIFCHLACVFLPGLYFFEQANTPFEKFWILSPLNIITNGNAAVQCFFVLSGFLITRKIYNKQKPSQLIDTYKKLLRVVIPGIIFAALLMIFGQMYHLKALEVNRTLEFVNTYNNFPVSIFSVVKDIFLDTFIKSSIYVGPFWTIKYEILGAVLITAASYLTFKNAKNRKLTLLLFGIFLYFMDIQIFPFVLGALVYECIYSKNAKTFLDKIVNFICKKKILLFCILLCGLYLFTTNSYMTSIWKPLNFLSSGIVRAIGFSMCLFCTHESNILKNLLSTRLLKFLGKISAYIYAFHWPIILSIGCGLYLLLQNIPYYTAVAIISMVVLTTSILLSYGYIKLYPIISQCIKQGFFKVLVTIKEKKKA